MAWANSGIYPATVINSLSGTGSNLAAWDAVTNKFFLTSNSDSTLYAAALGGTGNIYAATYEVSGTGWAAGGVVLSAFSGGSLAPTTTVTGTSPVLLSYGATNLSESGTTLSGAYGGYFYSITASFLYKWLGVYFGGSSYSTSAGTFAITWASGVVATISCAANT
jgi:hypothetical protein